MTRKARVRWIATVCAIACAMAIGATMRVASAEDERIPQSLRSWRDWVLWPNVDASSPPLHDNPATRISLWPARLEIAAEATKATWSMDVTIYDPSWIPLPGSTELWPEAVTIGEKPIVVVEHEGRPATRLPAGRHHIAGTFQWPTMPRKIAIPAEIGVVGLSVESKGISVPYWDAQGDLWLRRELAEQSDRDNMTVNIYRALEDGIPLWLRSDVELTVSGKSREESLGTLLPPGWTLSSIVSNLPAAVDSQGKLTVQVRAGTWTVELHAFRTHDTQEIAFAADAPPPHSQEWIAFRAKPELRLAELQGPSQVNVAQTTFPSKWRGLPVYQWDTKTPLRIVEKFRGMGPAPASGLRITRQAWLDEDGGGLTFRDLIQGEKIRLPRLDVANGQQLGAVQINGIGQLITKNPFSEPATAPVPEGAPAAASDVAGEAVGVELRTRNLNLQATSRAAMNSEFSATGWRADANSLSLRMYLPPGWRMLALFGADRVDGDWLTAWTLLDLFLLLVFSLAVVRMRGLIAGLVAFVAFALSYHEFGAPRISWLFLLVPLALMRVVPPGTAQSWLRLWRNLAVVALLLILIPFAARQLQTLIYPQLEGPGIRFVDRGGFIPRLARGSASNRDWMLSQQQPMLGQVAQEMSAATGVENEAAGADSKRYANAAKGRYSNPFQSSNFLNDAKAKVQTGPAQPEWAWTSVDCSWNGPVSANQTIRPILISLALHRLLTLARLVLIALLVWFLLSFTGHQRTSKLASLVTSAALMFGLTGSALGDEYPAPEMLETLRQRLLEAPDAFPHAAAIPSAKLSLQGSRLTTEAEIHAAFDVAVPLPGRLPAWSPVSVQIDGKPAESVCRRDGHLWIMVSAGVHRVTIVGLLPDSSEWEWSSLLSPRHVVVDAPDWNVTGISPEGTPEAQVFFRRRIAAEVGSTDFDRRTYESVAVVDRTLELGLIWKVHHRVERLSTTGRALDLRIPLLENERVISENVAVEENQVVVRLGPDDIEFAWESELAQTNEVRLQANDTNAWVERWRLATSPVWHAESNGIAPIYEDQAADLIPVWHPWPGERVAIRLSRPEAVPGETLTVQRASHSTVLGSRMQASTLALEIESSLGGELPVELDSAAKVQALKRNGEPLPVRTERGRLLIPVQPGKQSVTVEWRNDRGLPRQYRGEAIRLPGAVANISTDFLVPESRWILWAQGPLLGPAVRFWFILAFALIAALVLGGLRISPLRRRDWTLLVLGLTQVPLVPALLVVAWFFLMAYRGQRREETLGRWHFNLWQVFLVLLTVAASVILVVAVGEGLLGRPEMFIQGNGSTRDQLKWFQPAVSQDLPQPMMISVSVWVYRVLMLLWALWLALSVLRWALWGWRQFSQGGYWKRKPPRVEMT